MEDKVKEDNQAEPNRKFQYLAMMTSSINIITAGMIYGWATPSFPKLLSKDSHIPLTNEQGSLMVISLLCGAVCGAILAGIFLDRIGRKNIIQVSAAPFFVCWIMTAFSKSASTLILARFIGGISDSMVFCTVPMYLAEIADPKIRGFLETAMITNFSLGFLIMNLIGSYLSISTTALISSVFPLVSFATFIWMPESPYYLLLKGEVKKARHSLSVFRGSINVEPELQRISKAIEEEKINKGNWYELFTSKVNRKALFIVIGIRAIQQLSGSMPIMFYLQIIFKETGSDIAPETISTIYFIISMTFGLLSSLIIDRIGRRPLLFFSLTGSCLALLTEGSYFYAKNVAAVDTSSFTILPILALSVFIMSFNLGVQPMPYIFLGELFSTNVKAFAFSFTDLYYCGLSMTASKFFQFAKDKFGMHVPFFGFACITVLGIVFTAFFVPETKGKNLEQIQDELRGRTEDTKTMELKEMIQKQ